MTRLLLFVIDICLLRKSPADAPAHSYALFGAVISYFILLVWIYDTSTAVPAVLPALQIITVTILAIRIMLQVHGHQSRFSKTLFTLLASSVLMSLVVMFFTLPLRHLPDDSSLYLLLVFGQLLLWIWSFVIDAHIFRRVLDASFAYGMLMAVLVFSINFILINWWYVPLVDNTIT